MTYKKIFYLYDVDRRRFFSGWMGETPMWSDEMERLQPYSSKKSADDDYEILKRLGFSVIVEG